MSDEIIEKEKFALLIGINYTDSRIGRLNGCVNDALLMKNLIKSKLGFPENNITMLLDYDTKNNEIFPSKANIIDQMRILFSRKNAQLFFFYSGHGAQDTGGSEHDGKEEVLVPAIGGIIRDNEIRALIDRNMSKTSNLYIIMDACNSGTNFDLPFMYKNKEVSETRESIGDLPFIIKISSSIDEQLSNEISFGGTPYGVLTYLFDKHFNHKFTYKQMVDLLQIKIQEEYDSRGITDKQTPLATSSRKNNFDDKMFSTIDEMDDKKNTNLILILSLSIGIPVLIILIYFFLIKK